MRIVACQDKIQWEHELVKKPNASFLQSWEWGEFQRAVGREPVRLQVVENQEVTSQLQGFVHRLGLGVKYLYVPKCQMSNVKCQMFIDYCRAARFVFVRLEPISDIPTVTGYGLRVTGNRQPRHSLILDVSHDESALLAAMHSKTRYNISLAERKGVMVREDADAEVFWQLNQETVQRDEFRSHQKLYYAAMLKTPIVHQLTAYLENKAIAANILVHFGDTLTYVHGASSSAERNLMAPYLLQWEGIRLAKRLGCTKYDLWGVAPLTRNTYPVTHNSEPRSSPPMSAVIGKQPLTSFHGFTWEAAHPWTGITRFKVGFGGIPVSYGQAVDVALRPMMYRVYQLAKNVVS